MLILGIPGLSTSETGVVTYHFWLVTWTAKTISRIPGGVPNITCCFPPMREPFRTAGRARSQAKQRKEAQRVYSPTAWQLAEGAWKNNFLLLDVPVTPPPKSYQGYFSGKRCASEKEQALVIPFVWVRKAKVQVSKATLHKTKIRSRLLPVSCSGHSLKPDLWTNWYST